MAEVPDSCPVSSPYSVTLTFPTFNPQAPRYSGIVIPRVLVRALLFILRQALIYWRGCGFEMSEVRASNIPPTGIT